jgi:hypothetical protein
VVAKMVRHMVLSYRTEESVEKENQNYFLSDDYSVNYMGKIEIVVIPPKRLNKI